MGRFDNGDGVFSVGGDGCVDGEGVGRGGWVGAVGWEDLVRTSCGCCMVVKEALNHGPYYWSLFCNDSSLPIQILQSLSS